MKSSRCRRVRQCSDEACRWLSLAKWWSQSRYLWHPTGYGRCAARALLEICLVGFLSQQSCSFAWFILCKPIWMHEVVCIVASHCHGRGRLPPRGLIPWPLHHEMDQPLPIASHTRGHDETRATIHLHGRVASQVQRSRTNNVRQSEIRLGRLEIGTSAPQSFPSSLLDSPSRRFRR